MLRGLVWTLRQRRYAALALFMVVLAMGCAAAGTFEIHRLREKRSDNARLIANAHAAAVPLTRALVPVTGDGRPAEGLAVRDRRVTATGRYDAAAQTYVGNRSQGGRPGFWVLTPLRSAAGTLLVARGFVVATATGAPPTHVASPPAGSVRITGWLATATDSANRFGDEVSAINARQQAQRLGTPVYQAYLTLDAGQPGTAGLRALPGPTLSNPSGGASEWQLMSYVVQWYAFAALALAAPFLFARAEIRAARRRFLGYDPDEADVDLQARSAGTAALGPATTRPSGADLAVRSDGTVARMSELDADVRRRAIRLADRYGLSLGPGIDSAGDATVLSAPDEPVEPAQPRHRIGAVPDLPDRTAGAPARTSAGLPFSSDDYHGSYNDYLWQLALADGAVPDVLLPRGPAATADALPDAGPDAGTQLPPSPGQTSEGGTIEGRTIEGGLAEPDQDEHRTGPEAST
ncbi:MAG TPA: SURF1 family protein [Jatrophihabitantaceae bacterium]